jgi:hypothetical protein
VLIIVTLSREVDATCDIEGDYRNDDTGFGESLIPNTQQELSQEHGGEFSSDMASRFGSPSLMNLPPKSS